MYRKWLVVGMLVVGFALIILPVVSSAIPQQQRSNQDVQTSPEWEYAQLRIGSDKQVTWDEGGNQIPQPRSLRAVQRELDGSGRDTVVNLLSAIGKKGWELVQVDDQIVWTFKRPATQ